MGSRCLASATRHERRGLFSLQNFSSPLWLFQERSVESRDGGGDDSGTAELLYVLQQRLGHQLCLLDLFRAVPTYVCT